MQQLQPIFSIWLSARMKMDETRKNKTSKRSLSVFGLLLFLYLLEYLNYSSLVDQQECHMHRTFTYNFYEILNLAFLLFFVLKDVLLHLPHLISCFDLFSVPSYV